MSEQISYTKVDFRDHVVDMDTGEIVQQGTPLNRKTLGHMDDGIAQIAEAVNKLVVQSGTIISDEQPDKPCKLWLKPMGNAAINGGFNLSSNTIVSDEQPTAPCGLWLKPMGGATISDALGGGTAAINLQGVHVGDEPPTDTSRLWVQKLT